MSSSGSSIWSMSVVAMCEGCAKLYRGDGSCTDPEVPPAEQARRAAAGECDSAAQTHQEPDLFLRADGSMFLSPEAGLWIFRWNLIQKFDNSKPKI